MPNKEILMKILHRKYLTMGSAWSVIYITCFLIMQAKYFVRVLKVFLIVHSAEKMKGSLVSAISYQRSVRLWCHSTHWPALLQITALGKIALGQTFLVSVSKLSSPLTTDWSVPLKCHKSKSESTSPRKLFWSQSPSCLVRWPLADHQLICPLEMPQNVQKIH